MISFANGPTKSQTDKPSHKLGADTIHDQTEKAIGPRHHRSRSAVVGINGGLKKLSGHQLHQK